MSIAMNGVEDEVLLPVNPRWHNVFRPDHEQPVVVAFRGRTKQEFRDECDLNVLMKRYERTGVLPSARVGQPQFVDCTQYVDFQSSLEVVASAERAFMALPARVRAEFDNDPAKFVEYACDPENVGRMREWGLAEPEKVPDEPVEVRVVNPSDKPAE